MASVKPIRGGVPFEILRQGEISYYSFNLVDLVEGENSEKKGKMDRDVEKLSKKLEETIKSLESGPIDCEIECYYIRKTYIRRKKKRRQRKPQGVDGDTDNTDEDSADEHSAKEKGVYACAIHMALKCYDKPSSSEESSDESSSSEESSDESSSSEESSDESSSSEESYDESSSSEESYDEFSSSEESLSTILNY